MKKYKYAKKVWAKRVGKYFDELEEIEKKHWKAIRKLETKMRQETSIDDIEFIFIDGQLAGIGNISRTMELIDGYDVEIEKRLKTSTEDYIDLEEV